MPIDHKVIRVEHLKNTSAPWFWLIMIVLFSCTTTSAQETTRISNEEFVELTKNKEIQLVDVRTPEEVSYGVIKGAQHIDIYDPDFESRLAVLDTKKPVAVYCAAGGRSAQATAVLEKLGFSEVYDLTEGIRGWKSQGRELVALDN